MTRYTEILNDIDGEYSNAQQFFFDKGKCIENIRFLLKEKDIRIGQIEKAARCTPGYLSRLDKEGNKSDPSIEFICAAADLLGVSIDTLVNGKLNNITPTEQYLLEFINQMIKDTKLEEIVWKKMIETDFHNNSICRDLFSGDEYRSRFMLDTNIVLNGNSYYAKLPGTNEQVYLISVSDEQNLERTMIELYFLNYETRPICSTVQVCESVVESLKALYKETEIMTSHLQIDDHSRGVISKYLRRNSFDDIPF